MGRIHRTGFRSTRRFFAITALFVVVTGVAGTPAAWAHEGEAADAGEAVRQAIAYIVNEPGDMEAILDKVDDAMEAEDTTGVDLAAVERAKTALENDEMADARALLESAIGARPDLTGTDVRPILQVPPGSATVPLAVGAETGTFVVTDKLPGRGGLTGADLLLLATAALVGVAGVLLSIRLRPPDTVRSLRRQIGRPARG